MKNGEIILIENLRFESGELENNVTFARQLSSIADIYINDAFGTCHRKHASVHNMVKNFTHKICGVLVAKEMKYLKEIRDFPKRPLLVIIGGSKISDKIYTLEQLTRNADKILLGGALAYTFLSAIGKEIGNSLIVKLSASPSASDANKLTVIILSSSNVYVALSAIGILLLFESKIYKSKVLVRSPIMPSDTNDSVSDILYIILSASE